jgi:hypothetical protein
MSCGQRIHRIIDESCAPSFIRCICGGRYSLRVEEEDLTVPLPDIADDVELADVVPAARAFSAAARDLHAG